MSIECVKSHLIHRAIIFTANSNLAIKAQMRPLSCSCIIQMIPLNCLLFVYTCTWDVNGESDSLELNKNMSQRRGRSEILIRSCINCDYLEYRLA